MCERVFSYGFINLISLNLHAQRVQHHRPPPSPCAAWSSPCLRSVGLTQRGFARMMDYECIIYGRTGACCGPAGIVMQVTYGIYRSVAQSIAPPARFYIPR